MNKENNIDSLVGKSIPVKVRFFLKFRKSGSTCNDNGYELQMMDWAWFKKRGSIKLWDKILGTGDDGTRCEG